MPIDLSAAFRTARAQLGGRPLGPLPPRSTLWGWVRAALAFQQARPRPSDVPAPDDSTFRYLRRLHAGIGSRLGDQLTRPAGRGFRYAVAQLAVGHYEEGIEVLSAVIREEPDHAAALAARAAAYRLTEEDDLAVADATRAVRLQPDLAWAYATRGAIHRVEKEYARALWDLDRAIELLPDYEWCIAGRGETYRLMGHPERALVDLNRSYELNPRNEWALQCRISAYMDLQDGLTAFRVFREGVDAFRDGDVLLGMGLPALTYRLMGMDLTRYVDEPHAGAPPQRAASERRRWPWTGRRKPT
ncbi:tetratricopeptide repeat protein [Streptomyces sp. CRN 30]|uniref:tetratricopeptide repeat protein n=1 Tax=Streptomyces sp. CRN 30 TaxID=3075613 RepID=UPI002A80C3E1|nr:tetratricopeptide repeat protein [Streptomyces sp. CRN 30]